MLYIISYWIYGTIHNLSPYVRLEAIDQVSYMWKWKIIVLLTWDDISILWNAPPVSCSLVYLHFIIHSIILLIFINFFHVSGRDYSDIVPTKTKRNFEWYIRALEFIGEQVPSVSLDGKFTDSNDDNDT